MGIGVLQLGKLLVANQQDEVSIITIGNGMLMFLDLNIIFSTPFNIEFADFNADWNPFFVKTRFLVKIRLYYNRSILINNG